MIKAFWVWGVIVLLYQIYANHYGIYIAGALWPRAVVHGAPGAGMQHK